MNDAEFLRAFNDTTLEPFHHRDHLRVTYLYLSQFGEAGTRERLGKAILRYAAARNGAEKYHETITQTWISLVAAAKTSSFEEMLEANPHLLDKNLLNQHYSSEVLKSPQARAEWIQPDLNPLPISR